MRWIVIVSIFVGSSAVADESDICAGWALDRVNLETLMTANEEWRDALESIPATNPNGPLAQQMVEAMSLVLEGATGAVDVTGDIYEKTCPKPS